MAGRRILDLTCLPAASAQVKESASRKRIPRGRAGCAGTWHYLHSLGDDGCSGKRRSSTVQYRAGWHAGRTCARALKPRGLRARQRAVRSSLEARERGWSGAQRASGLASKKGGMALNELRCSRARSKDGRCAIEPRSSPAKRRRKLKPRGSRKRRQDELDANEGHRKTCDFNLAINCNLINIKAMLHITYVWILEKYSRWKRFLGDGVRL